MDAPRVLIADDDPHLVEVLGRRCQSLGLDVVTAASAMEALAAIQQRRPSIVLLDVDMPAGSGFGVCEMLAHHDEFKQIPIVMLTGRKDPETVRRCYDLCVYYVTKCTDVWPRVKPLLVELLELGESAASGDVSVAAPREPVSVEEPLIGAPPESPLAAPVIDQIFSALGFAYGDSDEFGDGEATEHDNPDAGRPWILCIDDDAQLAHGLELRLKEHGVAVERAFSGREGYRSAFMSPARAILLDYEMPEGNGAYVLRRLKENPLTRNIPVIVLTGCRDRQIERQMYELGAVAFLRKPYNWSQLWDELHPHLWPEPAVAEREEALVGVGA